MKEFNNKSISTKQKILKRNKYLTYHPKDDRILSAELTLKQAKEYVEILRQATGKRYLILKIINY